jgi:C-terminal peptidase prc
VTRTRLILIALALSALACRTLFPPRTPTPGATARPPATQRVIVRPTDSPAPPATPSATPAATISTSGVRACDYAPGVSAPAEMPPHVVNAPVPTPYPLPAPPPNTAVDAGITARQLSVYQDLWNTVNDEYVYADFNGRDWRAIGEKYERLIRQGLTDDDFHFAMGLMLAELGDEHSDFQSPEEVREEEAAFQGNNDYVGIGVLWTSVPGAGHGVIILAFPNSPAAEAGLRSHDLILAVNGEPALDANGDLSSNIRGPAGTPVTITAAHPGGEPFDLTLVRRQITGALPIDYCLVPGTRIGYLFLPGFDDATIPDQVRAALEALTAGGPLDGLVLDNRQNGGGALSVVEPILGFFTEGTVGYFVNHDGERPLSITPQDIGGSQTVPLAVLVDVDTASFGEVVSGILQNSRGARVVGRTTLGNVETLWGYDFEDGSRAWIAHDTFQPVDLSNGIWEETGIQPDVSVPTRWDLFTEANDPALAVAVELLSRP